MKKKFLYCVSLLFFFIRITCAFESFSSWKNAVDVLPMFVRQNMTIDDVIRQSKAGFGVQGYSTAGLTWASYKAILQKFYAVMGSGSILDKNHWVNRPFNWDTNSVQIGQSAPANDFFTPFFGNGREAVRQHYVQKLVVPVGSRIVLHGDLHGDVHSVLASIAPYMDGNKSFKIRDNNVYMVFLGDYVDRGWYGWECIYTLMRLKVENPDRVFLCRGNHEDGPISDRYGFAAELVSKIKGAEFQEAIAAIYDMYSILPAAIYLGSGNNYILCCHGGIELGFDPRPLLDMPFNNAFSWVNDLHQRNLTEEVMGKPFVAKHASFLYDDIVPVHNTGVSLFDVAKGRRADELTFGFLWNDFAVDKADETRYQRGRGWLLGYDLVPQFLRSMSTAKNKLSGVFRAHQHTIDPENAMMKLLLNLDGKNTTNKGVAKLWASGPKNSQDLWEGIVVTFNLSPSMLFGLPAPVQEKRDSSWPGFDFDTIGELTTAQRFDDWKLVVKTIQTVQLPLYRQKWDQSEQDLIQSLNSLTDSLKNLSFLIG